MNWAVWATKTSSWSLQIWQGSSRLRSERGGEGTQDQQKETNISPVNQKLPQISRSYNSKMQRHCSSQRTAATDRGWLADQHFSGKTRVKWMDFLFQWTLFWPHGSRQSRWWPVFAQTESFAWKPVHIYVMGRESSRITEKPLTLLAAEWNKKK